MQAQTVVMCEYHACTLGTKIEYAFHQTLLQCAIFSGALIKSAFADQRRIVKSL